MTTSPNKMSDEELLESILDVSSYDFLPKKYHTQAAVPAKIFDKAIEKAKQKRLFLIKQHREAYAIEKEATLLNALGLMYGQYCKKPYGHDFMSAGEGAIEILEDYGIHDESWEWDEKSYDKLEKKVAELREKVGKKR